MTAHPIVSVAKNDAANKNHSSETPFLSVVIPCYNTREYLPEFFASLALQESTLRPLEFIFVVDGCPQHSETLIAKWMQAAPYPITLVVQENQGPGGARNTGIDHASGDWITFLDSDDKLSTNYFKSVLASIDSSPRDVHLHVTRLIRLGSHGRPVPHSLDFKWNTARFDGIVDLDEQPEFIQLSSATAVFRREMLDRHQIRFDARLKRRFEDAHLIATFLLCLPQPKYRIVSDALYFYREHDASLISQSREALEIYEDVMDIAFRDLRKRAGESCPTWLSNTILYEISWLFVDNSRQRTSTGDLPPSTQARLGSLCREFIEWVGLSNVRAYHVTSLPFAIRSSWEAAADPLNGSGYILKREFDAVRSLQRIVVHSARAVENLTFDNAPSTTSIAYRKVRTFEFFGEVWSYEHIFWVTADSTSAPDSLTLSRAEGDVPLFGNGRPLTAYRLSKSEGYVQPDRGEILSIGDPSPVGRLTHSTQRAKRIVSRKSHRLTYSLAFRASQVLSFRKKYKNAWLLVDREDQANDNAEALYRYLRECRPDINAWFALSKSAPAYKRLKREGFKIVPYRSKRHFILFKEAKVLASAQADLNILQPFPKSVAAPIPTFAFLQHGVIKDSLHKWLNPKPIDVFVTSTTPEFDSVAGDNTPYNYSRREVVLTGLPRHDRLHRLYAKHTARRNRTRTVIIAPTWRQHLLTGSLFHGTRRAVDDFESTEFARGWSDLLNSEIISTLVRDPSVRVLLLLHPNLDPYWPNSLTPSGIERISFTRDDVQSYIAQCDVMVTDFSSLPFEAAFCNALSIYYQFDRDSFYAGGSARIQGYFTYEDDGFGPVCETLSEFERNFSALWDDTHPMGNEYRERVSRLFPVRDDQASARVVDAIERRIVSFSADAPDS